MSLSIPPDTPLESRKRAVIVGASTGIGAEIARLLGREGWFLALLARSGAELMELAEEINQQAGEPRAAVYRHDVLEYAAIPQLFQTLLADLKRIDAIVYVAGVMPTVQFSEYNFVKEKSMIDVNLLGGMAWLGQAAALFERLGAGQIVGISSNSADRGRVKNPGYNASKAGFDAYLEALRNRLTRSGVHVLTVRPGPVKTRITRETGGLFMVPPQTVARDVYKGMRKRKQIVYSPAKWRFIMFIVRNIPSVIFRRMNF